MSNQLVPNPIIGSPASAPLPLPLPPTTTNQAAAVAPASVGTGHGAQPPASAGAAPKPTNPQQRALQQQIQAQLQSQLQAQLQAAASRGKQANITPEMIQAQAQAMVQAAAQAQAVVAAAKNRGGGLVPMNAAQIHALSQIQAQAIVNARPQTALVGSGRLGGVAGGEKPTPQQIQNQVQLQAQALVHAHTQAQISAGIYKGGDAAAAAGGAAKQKHAAPPQAPHAVPTPVSNPMAQLQSPAQLANQMKRKHPGGLLAPAPAVATVLPSAPPRSYAVAPVSSMAGAAPPPSAGGASIVPSPSNPNPGGIAGTEDDGLGGVIMPANSPEFLAKLDECLTEFWSGQLREMRALGTDKVQTEQDFKNHNDLPLARIKRIMKSDEDVRMISAEAPVLFAKACEMFILEMTLRSWNYSENNKRKTLQKEDVKEAIQRTDIFDFLVDVID